MLEGTINEIICALLSLILPIIGVLLGLDLFSMRKEPKPLDDKRDWNKTEEDIEF